MNRPLYTFAPPITVADVRELFPNAILRWLPDDPGADLIHIPQPVTTGDPAP